jgi:tetratricopeptide (TPR) repeat protein
LPAPRRENPGVLRAPADTTHAFARAITAALVWIALGASAGATVSRERPASSHQPSPPPSPREARPGCAAGPHECATARIERGEFHAAIGDLERLLAKTPRDLKALNLLGIALTGAGRVADANARFRDALAIDAAFYPARKNLAVNEFNAGRLREARRHFEQVLARAPADEIAHVHLGEIEYSNRRLAAALAHYEKSGARPMSNPVWTLHYATSLLDAGQRPRALTVFNLLPADDADGRFAAGVALGRAGAHAEAARLFGTARAGYRNPYEAGYNQALMLIEARQYGEAVAVLKELLDRGDARAELYNLAARAYEGAGRVQEAYDALRDAARLEPTAETHYSDLASLCLDHENYDLGLEILDVGLKYLPDSGALHLQRGVILAMKGLMEGAEREFDTARRLAPGDHVPYLALAMAWMQSGRTPRAVEVLREQTRLDPSNAAMHHMLGIALMRSGLDPAEDAADEAVHAFEAAIRLDPQLAGARAELGKILLKRDDVTGAIRQLEQAVALDPDNAAPAYSLAQAYRRTGQTERAQALLSRVSQLNAQERGDDPDRDVRRLVVRIVRDGSAPPARQP